MVVVDCASVMAWGTGCEFYLVDECHNFMGKGGERGGDVGVYRVMVCLWTDHIWPDHILMVANHI